MSYEIPPSTKHKEQIILWMSFDQLVYLGIAIALFIPIFKSGLSLWVVIPSGIVLLVVAVFFMFFKGLMWVQRIIQFLSFRNATIHSKSMEKFIGVIQVKKNVVKTTTGNVAIIEAYPINFNVKNSEEKEQTLLAFEKLLNSINFPIQFVINSTPIDLSEYYTQAEQHVKSKYKKLFSQQKYFLEQTIAKDKVKNRRFYIVIKATKNVELKTEIVMKRLYALGLDPRRLKTNELLPTLHEFFNGAQWDLEDREASNVAHLLSPRIIKNQRRYIDINGRFCQVVVATGYPHSVERGFLDKIISGNEDYDISLHIEPLPLNLTLLQLNKELRKQKSDLFAFQQKSMSSPSLEIKHNATKKVLHALQTGKEKLFMVSLYILCKGNSKDEMELLTAKVSSELESMMIVPSIPSFAMSQGYQSMMPLANDVLQNQRNVATRSLSAFFPFTSPYLRADPTGIVLGLNRNKIPLIKNIFNNFNANGFILASSGGGKSYTTKLWLLRYLVHGTKILIVDPQGEYTAVTKSAKGQVINISKDSNTIINPLDLMGHDYINKRLSLMDLFNIMFEDITILQKAVLDKAIKKTYAKKKITMDAWKWKTPPTLSDLYRNLKILKNKAPRSEHITYTALLNRLQMYVKGGVFGFLDQQTNIDFKNRWVCFNISQMPKQVQPVMMFLILDYIYTTMKKDKDKKILAIDEAWSLLSKAREESYLFSIVKTCRKFNLGLLLITQDVDDLVNSKAGKALLNNSSYHLLLKQNPAAIGSVVRTFKLSKHEREGLLSASQGQGLLTLPEEHQELQVVASPEEHKIITTNPNEKDTVKAVQKETPKDIELDIDKLVHSADGMSFEEKNYLLSEGYEQKACQGFKHGKSKYYLIKKIGNESLDHTFMIGLTKQKIEKYTKKVAVYHTDKPDIIFTNKKGEEIVLEIETGLKAKNKKDLGYLEKKFTNLKAEYGKRMYVILLDSNVRYQYEKLGVTKLSRYEVEDFITRQFSGSLNSIIV
jgi:conjugal transfer ATP-binding protein TraC